jgi:hypothetical protein
MIYPSLPARYDWGIIRIGGAGIGNCLYAYFHAVVMAKEVNSRIIAPTWSSVRIGPLLRRELSLRRYGRMFRAHPDEITGIMKVALLIWSWRKSARVRVRVGQHAPDAGAGDLTIVEASDFTFVGLHPHRSMIRRRLLDILTLTPPTTPTWGSADYAAAHIRLGDFASAQPDQIISGKIHNLRIPISWYEKVITRVRQTFPELPILIFSDGREDELADILAIDGVSLRRGPNDVADLLSLAQARLLIGSNSTFSRWAAFLGDMPSIWLKTDQLPERPTGTDRPIFYIAEDFERITAETVTLA